MKTQKERLKNTFMKIGIHTTEVQNEFTSNRLSTASSIVISREAGQVEFTFDSEGFLVDVRIYGDEK
tara:strand:+ start:610 stop:810 length:201 start_codon:yes stop_codon:yes gene_type:complete